jgi:signal transduction histidine kinase
MADHGATHASDTPAPSSAPGSTATRRPRDRIWSRFLVAALVVAAVALAVVAVGVLQVGAASFAALMVAAGDSADHAHEMFDSSVALVFGLAAAIAATLAIIVAILLARRLAKPVERIADAARRLADGDLDVRVPEEGPQELRDLAAAYNAMAARLAEQEAVRREFIVNASHELRTPLTNLQGYLEALRDGVLPPDPAVFDSLREEVDRLTRLASSLDVLAGVGFDRGPAGDVDVGATVRASADLVAPAMARRSISLRVDAPPGLLAHARADELTQVLANLLQNAVRYTPAGGEVEVVADRAADAVRIRVANTGPGIPADDLPRVWERFYRVEKSRDRSRGGAGVGLAIVRQLVEDAGGRVGVTSEGGWTTFWLTLPARA